MKKIICSLCNKELKNGMYYYAGFDEYIICDDCIDHFLEWFKLHHKYVYCNGKTKRVKNKNN